MAFDWSISGYSPFFEVQFAWLLIAHWELLISWDACLVIVSTWEIDMLIALIHLIDCLACLACLNIVTLILPCLFFSLHMYRFTIVYRLTWWVDSLTCILSWSSSSMLSLSPFILIVMACMWTWVIYLYFAWLYVAWLSSSMWSYVIFPCGSHIYPITSNPLVSIISFISVFTFASVRPCVCLFLQPSWRLGVRSSDGLYRYLRAFWRKLTHRRWLESNHWRLV